MAARQNVSYPTLRNRLNALIDALENLEVQREGSRTEILKLLENGKISAKDVENMLQKL